MLPWIRWKRETGNRTIKSETDALADNAKMGIGAAAVLGGLFLVKKFMGKWPSIPEESEGVLGGSHSFSCSAILATALTGYTAIVIIYRKFWTTKWPNSLFDCDQNALYTSDWRGVTKFEWLQSSLIALSRSPDSSSRKWWGRPTVLSSSFLLLPVQLQVCRLAAHRYNLHT